MVNEALLKILCHNLVVLIHEMYELGIVTGLLVSVLFSLKKRTDTNNRYFEKW
jgi:hypothetical protein